MKRSISIKILQHYIYNSLSSDIFTSSTIYKQLQNIDMSIRSSSMSRMKSHRNNNKGE